MYTYVCIHTHTHIYIYIYIGKPVSPRPVISQTSGSFYMSVIFQCIMQANLRPFILFYIECVIQ